MEGGHMKSLIVKRSIVIRKRKTSVSLEDFFWKSLKEIAESRNQNLYQLIGEIDGKRKFANLSSGIRLFVLQFYKDQFDRQSRISEESKIAAQ
jgi:predicted DNA-binding ribbon-helix-helix protein